MYLPGGVGGQDAPLLKSVGDLLGVRSNGGELDESGLSLM